MPKKIFPSGNFICWILIFFISCYNRKKSEIARSFSWKENSYIQIAAARAPRMFCSEPSFFLKAHIYAGQLPHLRNSGGYVIHLAFLAGSGVLHVCLCHCEKRASLPAEICCLILHPPQGKSISKVNRSEQERIFQNPTVVWSLEIFLIPFPG